MIKLVAPYRIENIERASMKDVINFLENATYFGIDTEASGNIKLGVHGLNLVMLQVGDEHTQYIIDARYNDIKVLNKYFVSKKLLKIGHNLKFDAALLKKYGIVFNNIYDTMVASMVLSTGLDVRHSLVECGKRYLDINIDSNQLNLFVPATSKAIRSTFSNIMYEDFSIEQIYYGAIDVEIACLLRTATEKHIELNKLSKVLKLENKFALVLADLEHTGIPVNTTKWLNLIAKAEDSALEMEDLLNEHISEFSPPINWNSSQQVVKVFKHLGIPTQIIDKKSKKGDIEYKDSVGAATLKKYINRFPIVATYIKYKGYKKLHSSYGIKFLAKINPVTNRIHSNYIQIINTGRIASSNPNLQQIPRDKEYRECIEAPEGRTFVIADYSGQELHIVAHLSQDKNMLEILRNKGDLHKATGAALYNISVDKVTKAQRQDGKTANFTIVYGGGAEKLMEVFGVSSQQAKQMLERVFNQFPGLRPFQINSLAKTLKNGYISIDILGRKSYIPNFDKYLECERLNKTLGKNAPKQANTKKWVAEMARSSANFPVQGTAAFMTKLAMVYLREYLLVHPKDFVTVLPVHDEIVIECDATRAQEMKLVLEDCMSRAAHYFCSSVAVPSDAFINKVWIKD